MTLCVCVQSWLCGPMVCSPPGSSVHEISQARILQFLILCFYFFLQGILPTQGLDLHLLHLLHCQVDSLPLVPPGKPEDDSVSPKTALSAPAWGHSWMWLYLDVPLHNSLAGRESTCNAGDPGLISGLGRSTGEGIGYPLQYSWVSLMAQLV